MQWLSIQHCLLAMIGKLRKSLDRGGWGGASVALLIDLSKVFDNNCKATCLWYQIRVFEFVILTP